jgi:hypothetical protein
MPVIEHYRTQSKVAEVRPKSFPLSLLSYLVFQIDSSPAVDEVHATTITAVEKVLV